MAEDEEATVRTLTAYRVEVELLIERHRGRVVDSPAENLLGEFSSAREAIHCAVEIQDALETWNADLPPERRMRFRIGIHLGDLIIEGEKIYGDGVSVASGLELLAEPGGICISATVYEQVKNQLGLHYEDMGDQWVKNVPNPIRVFRIRLIPERAASPTARRGFWRASNKGNG
jgi:adenylate cyclase